MFWALTLRHRGAKPFGVGKTLYKHSYAKSAGPFNSKTQLNSKGGTILTESNVNIGTTFTIPL
jgi:hypothetical protein